MQPQARSFYCQLLLRTASGGWGILEIREPECYRPSQNKTTTNNKLQTINKIKSRFVARRNGGFSNDK